MQREMRDDLVRDLLLAADPFQKLSLEGVRGGVKFFLSHAAAIASI
jgi:hypothetical protein